VTFGIFLSGEKRLQNKTPLQILHAAALLIVFAQFLFNAIAFSLNCS
jgi:hypothetical protein